jgi:hypothetical protein
LLLADDAEFAVPAQPDTIIAALMAIPVIDVNSFFFMVTSLSRIL